MKTDSTFLYDQEKRQYMIFDNGLFIMNGSKRGDKLRVRTAEELVELINKVGFLPLFSNEVKGFSVEEHVSAGSWWTGDINTDPWEWRETISRGKQVAYGKFFGKKLFGRKFFNE